MEVRPRGHHPDLRSRSRRLPFFSEGDPLTPAWAGAYGGGPRKGSAPAGTLVMIWGQGSQRGRGRGGSRAVTQHGGPPISPSAPGKARAAVPRGALPDAVGGRRGARRAESEGAAWRRETEGNGHTRETGGGAGKGETGEGAGRPPAEAGSASAPWALEGGRGRRGPGRAPANRCQGCASGAGDSAAPRRAGAGWGRWARARGRRGGARLPPAGVPAPAGESGARRAAGRGAGAGGSIRLSAARRAAHAAESPAARALPHGEAPGEAARGGRAFPRLSERVRGAEVLVSELSLPAAPGFHAKSRGSPVEIPAALRAGSPFQNSPRSSRTCWADRPTLQGSSELDSNSVSLCPPS